MDSFLLSIKYDGSEYYGWERQPDNCGVKTIQGTLEFIISKIFKKNIRVIGVSRTDKGVHALDQKAVVKLPSSWEVTALKLRFILNKSLPTTIYVNNVTRVSQQFNLWSSVQSKTYWYFVNLEKVFNPFIQKYAFQIGKNFSVSKLNEIASRFIGTFNFFWLSGLESSTSKKTIRTILDINIKKINKQQYLKFSITGSGFLQHQIRYLISAILMIYNKTLDVEFVMKKIVTMNNNNKLIAISDRITKAPGSGLYLSSIKLAN